MPDQPPTPDVPERPEDAGPENVDGDHEPSDSNEEKRLEDLDLDEEESEDLQGGVIRRQARRTRWGRL